MTTAEELVALGRTLGEHVRDLVILAEGNISARGDGSQMLVKASGCSMGALGRDDILTVDRSVVMALVERESVTDDDVASIYRSSVLDSTNRLPSVEAILHAVLYEDTDTQVIAHTHPTAVNGILCSARPELLVEGSLFPDQVVVLGRSQVMIPYTDPGVPLARAVRDGVRSFRDRWGQRPRVIYLVNHGLFALAQSCDEAVQITEMAVKAARILHATLAAGGPQYLNDENVDRIDRRPDEHYRRALLSGDPAEG